MESIKHPGIAKGMVFLTLIVLLLQTTVSAEEIKLTGLNVSLSVLPFIESMKRSDGSFFYHRVCEEGKCTTLRNVQPQEGAWAVISYAALYNATKNPLYLNKMKAEMEDLFKYCPPDDVDCSVIGVQASKAYELTGDKRYLDYIRDLNSANMYENTMLNGILAREMALGYKYGIAGDNRADTLNLLMFTEIELNNKEDTVYTTPNGFELKKHACWVQAAWLEFYKALEKDKGQNITNTLAPDQPIPVDRLRSEMISSSKTFFDGVDFSSVDTNDINFFKIILTDIDPCIESLIMLHEATGEEKYLSDAVFLGERMLNQYWDSQYSPRFDGDNSFIIQGCRNDLNQTTCYDNTKLVTENGYAVYLFSLMGNQSFTVSAGETTVLYSKPIEDEYYEAYLPKKETNYGEYAVILLVLAAVALLVRLLALKGQKKKKK